MNHFKIIIFTFALTTAAASMYGCGSKRVENSEVPQQNQSNEPTQTQKVAEAKLSHYKVRSHDTLWAIAGKNSVYGDSFEWPLIFKANRDKIQDPDLIYPRQNFVIEKGANAEEMNHARQTAMDTPQFVSHSQPRETLPVNYF